MSDFKDLKVWQKAHALAVAVNRAAKTSRGSADAELRNQMKRAATSIPANIAEGRGKGSDKEQVRFLRISAGSAYELEAHLTIARDIDFLRPARANQLIDQVVEVRKMLFGLIGYLEGDEEP